MHIILILMLTLNTFIWTVYSYSQKYLDLHISQRNQYHNKKIWNFITLPRTLNCKIYCKVCIIQELRIKDFRNGSMSSDLVGLNYAVEFAMQRCIQDPVKHLSWSFFCENSSISYRNKSIDLQSKSIDWFLYDRELFSQNAPPQRFDRVLNVQSVFFDFYNSAVVLKPLQSFKQSILGVLVPFYES